MAIIEGIKDNIIKAYNYYNYFIGKSDSVLSFERKATSSDMPSFLSKKIVDDGKVTYLGKDTINGFVKFSFNTADATDEMKNLINPDNKSNKNNLFKYITDYSDGTVTMVVPMDGYDHRNIKDKLKDKVGSRMKKENMQINESVSWDYFDKYDSITDKYLPSSGEGETMASQIVTAITKLVYKWYNDGDVFDNTYYLQGWANDLSSYANWLYMNVPKCNLILDTIENIKTEGEYEDLLKGLTDFCFSDKIINKFKDEDKKGSIYSATGPYSFEDYEDEDEDWEDDEYEDEEWDEEGLTLREGDSKTSDYKFVYSTPSGRLSFEYIDASDDDDAMNKFREIHPYNVILKWGPNPHKNQNEELELKESEVDLGDFYAEGDWSSELDDYYDEVEYARDNHPDDKTIVPKLSKTVIDADGFTTDYVLYYDSENDKWICIFGDRDVYNPYNTEPDYETDSREDAYEWFDSYEGITESVMTPTPIPYKRNKEEELELKESSNQHHNYRVTFFDKSINDNNDMIITADSAKDAADKFKETNHTEILEIKNDSFTNPKTYYKQGWSSVREEELELAVEEDKTPLNLAVTSYQTGEWLNPEDFDNFENYDEYYSYYDMGPENFYKEYKDIADFSPEFIAQYSSDLQEDTSIETDEKAIKVINDVYKEKGNIDSDESISEIEKRIKQQGITMDADSLSDMIIKSAEMMDTLSESLSNRDVNKLEKELRAKIKEVFLSPSFGFEEDDWNDYVHVEITSPYVNSEGDKGTKVEVRAELSYEELMYLARKLDEILVKYDRDSYFEPVCPGIMDAYIWDNNSIRESLSEGIFDPSACINLDDADSTKDPEKYIEYLIDHELKLDRAKGVFKTVFKPIFFKAIKYLNTFKDVISNFQQRGNTFYIDYQRPVTEGKEVSFKDHHICQGCGKPLSQCTCEVEGLDFSGGTQVSNIGQHKVDNLDMIEDEE